LIELGKWEAELFDIFWWSDSLVENYEKQYHFNRCIINRERTPGIDTSVTVLHRQEGTLKVIGFAVGKLAPR